MTAPLCRFCNRPLKKLTTSFLFRDPTDERAAMHLGEAMGTKYGYIPPRAAKPEGHREQEFEYSWILYVSEENRPRTKAECAKFSNHPVVSVRRGGIGMGNERIGAFSVWDGESYQANYNYFCTIQCAAAFGRAMAKRGARL